MTSEEAVNAFWTSLSLIGLVYLIFWRTQSLAIDWFRDRMFKLRDELFDAAAGGLIAFDHPAYVTLRTTMNGFIRFCHKLSLLNVLLLGLVLRDRSADEGLFTRSWNDAIKELNGITLNKLMDYRNRMQVLVVAYSIMASPFTAIGLFLFLFLGFAVNSIGKSLYQMVVQWTSGIRNSGRMEQLLSQIDDTAYAGGDI
jgi:hypothetical protein